MKARIFWAVLGLVLLGYFGFRVMQVVEKRNQPEKKTSEVAVVRSARVVKADLRDKVSFTGTIRPRNEVDVFPKVGGRIEALPVQIGDKVKAGQLLAVVEHKEIAWQAKASEAAVQLAKANLEGARLNHDRTAALFAGGSATQAMVDQVKVGLALAQAQLAQAEAANGLAQQSLANATLFAPIAGTVIRRPVNLGTNVGPPTVVATLQDVATLKLEAAVDAVAYARLTKGALAEVVVDAFASETFPGKVTLLSPSLDSITRRAALEIEVDNESGKLLPNMFARADVVVGELKDAVAVPRAALFEAGGGAVVFRIKGGRAQMVRPVLGPADKGLVAVFSGLAEGDELAITGQAGLADGAEVKVASEARAESR
ncbi:MAG: efflux RND transporter periplasmic adaptor subunit [Deltaproteobacteria bacterium]|nr:efflux RND transporter periplasmic adaptor subunit [Deltaproteobacteria bacterium]